LVNVAAAGPLLVNDLARGAAWAADKAGFGDARFPSASGWLRSKLAAAGVPTGLLDAVGVQEGGGQSINEGIAQTDANRAAIRNATGGPSYEYEPKTTAGKLAKSGAQFGVAGAAYSPNGVINAAKGALAGMASGVASEGAGEATAGTPYEIPARLVGAMAGQVGVQRALRARTPTGAVSDQALHDTANRQFDQLRQSGTAIHPDAVRALAQNIRTDLTQAGATNITAPTVSRIIDRLDQAPQGGRFTVNNYIDLGKELKSQLGNREEGVASAIALNHLDSFLDNVQPQHILSGNPAADAQLLRTANANWGGLKRSQRLTAAEERGLYNAAVQHSGTNGGNTIRQQVRSMVTPRPDGSINPAMRGYSSEQRAAIDRLVRGTIIGNWLRTQGNRFGGGGGFGQALLSLMSGEAGMHVFGLPGAGLGLAVPAAGMAARYLSNRGVSRQLDKVARTVRADTPLGRQQAALARLYVLSQAQRPLVSKIVPNLYPSAARSLAHRNRNGSDDASE
jgi:hypothetical protein